MLMAEKKPKCWQLPRCYSVQVNWEQFERNWAPAAGGWSGGQAGCLGLAMVVPSPSPPNTLWVGTVKLQSWRVVGWAALISILYSLNEAQSETPLPPVLLIF